MKFIAQIKDRDLKAIVNSQNFDVILIGIFLKAVVSDNEFQVEIQEEEIIAVIE